MSENETDIFYRITYFPSFYKWYNKAKNLIINLIVFISFVFLIYSFKKCCGGRTQNGRGIGRGDHFLPYKFIKRTTEHWANFTKQLLIPSWGHQVTRKAAHGIQKEIGQNIKDKKRDKRARDRDPSQEGVLIEEISKHQETLSRVGLGEVFESRRAT